MSIKYKLKLNKRLYRQLLAADVAVVRLEQEDASSRTLSALRSRKPGSYRLCDLSRMAKRGTWDCNADTSVGKG